MSEPTQTNRKKSRRRNGDGNTYRHKNGWRTVISHKGHTVTAMGRSEQESRRLAEGDVYSLCKAGPRNKNYLRCKPGLSFRLCKEIVFTEL